MSTPVVRGYTILSRSGWTATASAHYDGSTYDAPNVLDGNFGTEYLCGAGTGNLTIDMGSPQTVSALIFFTAEGLNYPHDVSVSTSSDNATYTPVGTASWANNSDTKVINWTPGVAQYVRLFWTTTWSGDCRASEIYLANGIMWSVQATPAATGATSWQSGALLQNTGSWWTGTSLIFSFNQALTFDTISLTQAQDGITGITAYVSNDGATWGSAVGAGSYTWSDAVKSLTFAAQTASWLKLVLTTSHGSGNPSVGAAGFDLLVSPSSGSSVQPVMMVIC